MVVGLTLEGLDLGSTHPNGHAVFIFFIVLEFVDYWDVLGAHSTYLIGYILNGIIGCAIKTREEVLVYMELRVQFGSIRLNINVILVLIIFINYDDWLFLRIPAKQHLLQMVILFSSLWVKQTLLFVLHSGSMKRRLLVGICTAYFLRRCDIY